MLACLECIMYLQYIKYCNCIDIYTKFQIHLTEN